MPFHGPEEVPGTLNDFLGCSRVGNNFYQRKYMRWVEGVTDEDPLRMQFAFSDKP
jgi:hypothetical protein